LPIKVCILSNNLSMSCLCFIYGAVLSIKDKTETAKCALSLSTDVLFGYGIPESPTKESYGSFNCPSSRAHSLEYIFYGSVFAVSANALEILLVIVITCCVRPSTVFGFLLSSGIGSLPVGSRLGSSALTLIPLIE